MGAKRLVSHRIKLADFHIGLKLAIPCFGIKRGVPDAECCNLSGGKFLNLLFDRFHFAYRRYGQPPQAKPIQAFLVVLSCSILTLIYCIHMCYIRSCGSSVSILPHLEIRMAYENEINNPHVGFW